MSLPANDAFSLGLVHDATHRHPTLRRSASSTLSSFSSSSSSRSSPSATTTTVNGMPYGAASPRKTRRHNKTPSIDPTAKATTHAKTRPKRTPADAKNTSNTINKTVVTTNGGHDAAGVNGGGGGAAKKIDWEIPRKTLHSSIGFVTIYLYLSHESPTTVIYALSSALAVIVPADILRLRYPPFARLYERCLGFLMRESEKKTTNGVIWYILGATFVLSVLPMDIAVVAILILSWADTAASTVGRLFGPYTPPLPRRVPFLNLPLATRKSLAGFIASSITGACIAVGFWKWIAPMREGELLSWTWDGGVGRRFMVLEETRGLEGLGGLGGGVNTGGWIGLGMIGLVAGIVAGVAEALDLGSLDDNLTLPIISGGCLYGFMKLMGLFAS